MNIADTITSLTFKVLDETQHFANVTTDQDKPAIPHSAGPLMAERLWACGYRLISVGSEMDGQPRFFCEKMSIARRSPENYEAMANEASSVAADGDYFWNERFISALRMHGLTIGDTRSRNDPCDSYPRGGPVMAPLPCHGPQSVPGWPENSFIVWL